jgi:branched-chain amino acid transport system permease protein
MGIAGALVQRYLPANSSFTAAVLPSIPFVFIVVFLLYHLARSGKVVESSTVGGPLDRAIRPHGGMQASTALGLSAQKGLGDNWLAPVAMVAIVAILPLVLHGLWVGLVGEGMCFAVIFLSYTLVTGEGGMIWLCQITFAGVGGIAAAQLATRHGWPILAGILMGGLLAAAMGTVIGLLTIRLGDLYIALVTLTFGLLMENLVFSRQVFFQFGTGVSLGRPSFAQSDRAFSYLMLGVACVVSVLIVNLRRSTTGLGVNAVRWSEPASRTLGLSVLQMKVLLSAIAAFVAGIGGGFLASYFRVAIPSNYATLAGLVWLAILVTTGVRSNPAAMLAGLTFTFIPAIFVNYVPLRWGSVPAALFGLGAIFVARNPDGIVSYYARQLQSLFSSRRRDSPEPIPEPAAMAAMAAVRGAGAAPAPQGSQGSKAGVAGRLVNEP